MAKAEKVNAADTLLEIEKVDKEGKRRKVSIDTSGREVSEETAKTIEELEENLPKVTPDQVIGEVDWREIADILPVDEKGKPKMKLIELPKNSEERKIWQEWNRRLDAADREWFVEKELPKLKEIYSSELPTRRELYPEEYDVPTVREAGYGKQKVQEALSLPEIEKEEEVVEEKALTVKEPEIELNEVEKIVTPPPLPEEEKEEESLEWFLKEEIGPVWKSSQEEDDVKEELRQALSVALPEKVSFKGEAPISEWWLKRFNAEMNKYEASKVPELHELMGLDEVVDRQLKNRKKSFGGFLSRAINEIKEVGGVAQKLGYSSATEIEKIPGMEKKVSGLANILGKAKKFTEASLKRVVESVSIAATELKYLTGSKWEREFDKDYKKELENQRRLRMEIERL